MAFRVLVISGEEITAHVGIGDCITAVEEAFRAAAQGKTVLPTKYLYSAPLGFLAFMGGSIEPLDAMAIKTGSAREDNPSRGLPRVINQVILYKMETAEPLAIMDGNPVTALRTGAAAAIGAKYLARRDPRQLGIVGAGRVGRASLAAMSQCFELRKVYVADISDSARGNFVAEAKELYPFEIVEATFEGAVREVDILVTATPCREPIVKREWVPKGLHISAMGADNPGKQELDLAIVNEASIVCDRIDQCLEYGEINNANRAGFLDKSRIVGEIGEIILGNKRGRISQDQITIFDATGVGIQDAAAAKVIYETAVRKKIGTWVDL